MMEKKILVVDDGSTDGTAAFLKQVSDTNVTVILHERNMGKGAAIQTALSYRIPA